MRLIVLVDMYQPTGPYCVFILLRFSRFVIFFSLPKLLQKTGKVCGSNLQTKRSTCDVAFCKQLPLSNNFGEDIM